MAGNKCPVRCKHGGKCVRALRHERSHIGYCEVNGAYAVWGDDGICQGE